MRIVIAGVPRSGKTTLAKMLGQKLGIPVLHTDDYKELPWDEQKHRIHAAANGMDRVIVEGVAATRLFKLGFEPDYVIHTKRKGLASPQHKGMANSILPRVEAFQQSKPEQVLEYDLSENLPVNVADELTEKLR